jgi:hypothetical protein
MTIVLIGKVILQEPKDTGKAYWPELDQQIQGVVCNVVGRCLEAMLISE